MSQRFVAEDVAAQVADRLWRYISQHSAPSEVGAVVESLFLLPAGELHRLTAAHLIDADDTAAMLEAARVVLRELPSSVTRSEVELRAGIRQPVHWPRTYQRRYATGDRQRFVCRPPERAYDTALGRLVLLALRRCAELPQLAQLGSQGPLGEEAAERAATAVHLMKHAKLRDVRAVTRLPERTLVSLRRHRSAAPLINWVRRAAEALDDQSPGVVKAVIEKRLLPPAAASSLFELFVGFRLVDALVGEGFVEQQYRLIPNRKIPFARLRRGEEEAAVYWQRPLWAIEGQPAAGGRYGQALTGAEMSLSQLRPDFIVKLTNPDRLAFLEVKLTEKAGKARDRVGVRDALAYAYDAESLLVNYPEPHGLVVAWGAAGKPGVGKILVADQDAISAAVTSMLGQWPAP